jgi:hypothetical protein
MDRVGLPLKLDKTIQKRHEIFGVVALLKGDQYSSMLPAFE